jgi:D-glycero-D-manno-heptose 1,7-bisphosphate phosphatase
MTEAVRQAVILAGGRGSRLGVLTEETPKPLLPVGGRPFVEWVIADIARQGVERVILTTGYRAEAFDAWLEGWRSAAPVERVDLYVEERPLDTGGALCELSDELDDIFLVLNGDTLFEVSVPDLVTCLDGGEREPLMSIALREVEDVRRYGSVLVEGGTVVDWGEKRGAGRGWINGGVYVMRREALRGHSAPMSIERTLIPELVASRRVRASSSAGFFIDIGVLETYDSAQRSVPEWWDAAHS